MKPPPCLATLATPVAIVLSGAAQRVEGKGLLNSGRLAIREASHAGPRPLGVIR